MNVQKGEQIGQGPPPLPPPARVEKSGACLRLRTKGTITHDDTGAAVVVWRKVDSCDKDRLWHPLCRNLNAARRRSVYWTRLRIPILPESSILVVWMRGIAISKAA
jgi:hypothetical protein